MNRVLTIARKEWRTAFLSPVGLVFLGIFLAASLFVFFYLEGFFARNIADAKPFFRWMPILLVLLASAFTMRLWSEEFRSGTLEVLLTLPLRIRDAVLGKFLAGVGLVAVALVLTLPVPLTIAWLGDLDWGPVVGGYLGLLLLSGAYLAVGMFISSLTTDQLVSLLGSMLVCGLFVLLGYLPGLVPMGLRADELFRALGTGSRFESMLRGVLDLRDLAYYLSLAVLFLVLNGLVLQRRRWGQSQQGLLRHRRILVGVGLILANLLVLNLGLAPTAHLRVDLTEWGEYSISPVTRKLLKSATEPLLVRGYFSDKTHPLLDPLIPRLRDFLSELETVGATQVTTEFIDPTKDEQAEKEAHGKYGIRSVPFRFASRHEDSVVNAYFHILVRYGDQHEVIDFEDLIDVEVQGNDVRVRLRNLEYDVARAVQKVIYGFKSIEAICNQLEDKALLQVFASSKNLPEELQEVRPRIEKVAGKLKERCGGRFDFQIIDPDRAESGMTPEALYQQYGIKPMTMSLFDDRTFYLHLVVKIGEHIQALNASSTLTEADVRKELMAALQRRSPGFLKVVGIAASDPAPPAAYPGMPRRGNQYQAVEKQLSQTYQVIRTDLSTGRLPGEVDVLLVLNPRELGEKELFAIDQFLMRGGAAILTAGKWVFDPSMREELEVKQVSTGLDAFLSHYGVELGQAVVLDEDNAAFPVPVVRNLAGLRIREIQLVNYPPFVQVQGDGLANDNPATRALSSVVIHWPSTVDCKLSGEGEKQPVAPSCRPLLYSSEHAWEIEAFSAQPDYNAYPETGFNAPKQRRRFPLAVSLLGPFESYYQDRKPPVLGDQERPNETDDNKSDKNKSELRAGVVEKSRQDARLVVMGSSSFLDDMVLSISGQVSDAHLANLQLVTNLVDWSVEDVDLLQIRSKEQYARSLTRLDESEKIAWEAGNFGFAFLAILFIGLFALSRRNRATSILSLNNHKQEERSQA